MIMQRQSCAEPDNLSSYSKLMITIILMILKSQFINMIFCWFVELVMN